MLPLVSQPSRPIPSFCHSPLRSAHLFICVHPLFCLLDERIGMCGVLRGLYANRFPAPSREGSLSLAASRPYSLPSFFFFFCLCPPPFHIFIRPFTPREGIESRSSPLFHFIFPFPYSSNLDIVLTLRVLNSRVKTIFPSTHFSPKMEVFHFHETCVR